ncbi:MAG: trehalase family glycosidase [Bacteroidota bacterium]
MKEVLLYYKKIFSVLVLVSAISGIYAQKNTRPIIGIKKLASYVSFFNSTDDETVKNYIPNDKAQDWLAKNIPLFECPDTTLEKIYYYRWWTFRKHLKQTPDGFVFTEFITPMNHGGKYNTISSGLGHHIYEGRWLRDTIYLNQYINFWLYTDKQTAKPHFHAFSSWIDDAVYNYYLVTKDKKFIANNLLELHADYVLWEQEKQLPDGKFWQFDVRDAMEESISGGRKEKNVRPTINSYMYGNAKALSKMAAMTGNDTLRKKYDQKAAALKLVVQDYLWNDSSSFFEVRHPNGAFANAREAIGFIPWYFNIPPDENKYAKQWLQLTDTTGFNAPWGITTAERRHPLFRTHGSGHGCEWDGPVWPFATTQTLKGLSNLLTRYKNNAGMSSAVFYKQLQTYAWSHQKNGKPYIGEYQDEKTGEWLKGDNPRSSYYNHSSFADLIINDLIGLKPSPNNTIEIIPLIPESSWDWFCLQDVLYHGKNITIFYDKSGRKYKKGKGFFIYANGRQLYHGHNLGNVTVNL